MTSHGLPDGLPPTRASGAGATRSGASGAGAPGSVTTPVGRLTFEVTPADTALALGSGDVEVLATPRLLAWCEAATCVAVPPTVLGGPVTAPAVTERTSVGTRVRLDHLLATPVGGRIEVEARLTAVDGNLLRFEVRALDRHGGLVGSGEVTRAVVDRDRFAGRIPGP